MLRAIALAPEQTTWRTIALDRESQPILGVGGRETGLSYEAFSVPGKPPAYRGTSPMLEDTIACRITDPRRGKSIVYAPGGALELITSY